MHGQVDVISVSEPHLYFVQGILINVDFFDQDPTSLLIEGIAIAHTRDILKHKESSAVRGHMIQAIHLVLERIELDFEVFGDNHRQKVK